MADRNQTTPAQQTIAMVQRMMAPDLVAENARLTEALITIAQFPITDMRRNQDAVNMQSIAILAVGKDVRSNVKP